MTAEFNLSEKILYYGAVTGKVIMEEDVKEFIRLLKFEVEDMITYPTASKRFIEFIDKLAGDKLI